MKEPLVADLPLGAPRCTRHAVPGFLGAPGFELGRELRSAGHDASKPTVWLMEGLLPYLTRAQCCALATELGKLSVAGSALWGDSFSHTSVARGMVFHGVPFAEGLDDYDEVFKQLSGFQRSESYDMGGVELVTRGNGGRPTVHFDPSARISKESIYGRSACVMVRAYKTA